jgi:hypothetical protein
MGVLTLNPWQEERSAPNAPLFSPAVGFTPTPGAAPIEGAANVVSLAEAG